MNKQKMMIALAGLATLAAAVVYGAAPRLRGRAGATATVQTMFVATAQDALIADGKLTLVGVSPTTAFFADRPQRMAGHLATSEIVPLWSEGSGSFAKEPQNATLSEFAGGKMTNVTVALSNPVLRSDQLTFDVKVLNGALPTTSDGNGVSLFIDIIGMPLKSLSGTSSANPGGYRDIVY